MVQKELEQLLNDAEVSRELKIVELRITEQVRAITEKLEANRVGFYQPVWQSYLASWIFAITFPITVLLLWWVATHNVDIFNLLKNKFSPDIPQPLPTTQSSPNQ